MIGGARLDVQDFGLGIEEKDQRRIFERFERAVSYKRFGGMGMGLYIVKQIVDAHGGKIEVKSSPNHGSTFTLILPFTNGGDH